MILKVAALCVAVAMICSAIRAIRPEMATAISLAAGLTVIAMVWSELSGVAAWTDALRTLYANADDLTAPVLKGAGIAIVSQLGAQLCADAGESALAGRVTLAARVAMLSLCAPMLVSLVESIGGALG